MEYVAGFLAVRVDARGGQQASKNDSAACRLPSSAIRSVLYSSAGLG